MTNLVLDKVKDRILALLAGINLYAEDTITWIKSGEQTFRISKPDKHLVSYLVMFDQVKEKILLVDHKKSELWLPTGGHVEVDEDPTDTVIRECMEALYVTAEFCKEPIFVTQAVTIGKTAGHTDVSLWYVIKGNSNVRYEYDQGEFSDIKWFGLDEVPYEHSDPHMKRFISKFRMLL